VGFLIFSDKNNMKVMVDAKPPRSKPIMHDLIIALAFLGLIVAPAVVAARVGAGRETE